MSDNGKRYDARELKAADETAYALEELSQQEAAQFERERALGGQADASAESIAGTRKLAQRLRAGLSPAADLPENSPEMQRVSSQVRESVLSALDAQEATLATQSADLPRRSNKSRILAWSAVATLAASLLGIIAWSRFAVDVQHLSQTPDGLGYTPATERPMSSIDNRKRSLPDERAASQTAGPKIDNPAPLSGDLTERTLMARADSTIASAGNMSTPSTPGVAQSHPEQSDRASVVTGVNRKIEFIAPTEELAYKSKSLELQKESGIASHNFQDAQMRLPAGCLGLEGKAAGSQNGDLNRRYTDQSSAGQVGGGLGGQFDAGKMSADSNGLFGYGFGNDSGQQRESDESESLERRSFGRYSANEAYRAVPENPFWRPIGEQAMSTFSIDVDTASYANVRRFLNEGSLPPAEAVRLEEFINYFHYNYPQPEGNEPFAVDLKLFGCPWNAQHSLLRVGLQGREIKSEKRPISNIVYLVDVSGSMSSDDKLPLLKRGLTMMVDHLSENDTVSIVTYAGDAGVRLEPTNGTNKKKILDAIDSLGSGGSTNGAAGIEAAYRLAQQNFVKDGANRVILMTDGDLNVGVTSDEALVALIKEKAASGVFLTVLGFGTGNLKDAKLEGLADNGNGIYGYIDSLGEAHKVLVEQMSGSLVTIAKDVKIQIEFNPAQVAGYRLIGYENRVMANQDFANDRKDAGDIGAGHTVTALYEIVPVGAMLDTTVADASSGLKYQTVAPVGTPQAETGKSELRLTEAAKSGELARVALRYKTPEGTESKLIEFTAKSEVTSFSQADADCRFAAAVAAFGMQLRQSQFAGNMTLDAIAEIASAATNNDPSGHRAEFVELVRRAKSLQTGYEK